MNNNEVAKWVISNTGRLFFTSEKYFYKLKYKDNLQYTRFAEVSPVDAELIKRYINWRLTQKENLPEITFISDYKLIKIHPKEKLYERDCN